MHVSGILIRTARVDRIDFVFIEMHNDQILRLKCCIKWFWQLIKLKSQASSRALKKTLPTLNIQLSVSWKAPIWRKSGKRRSTMRYHIHTQTHICAHNHSDTEKKEPFIEQLSKYVIWLEIACVKYTSSAQTRLQFGLHSAFYAILERRNKLFWSVQRIRAISWVPTSDVIGWKKYSIGVLHIFFN